MNPDLQRLQPYPFEKLRSLFADLQPPVDRSAIALSIGEPKHPSPAFVLQAAAENLDKLANYPLTRGTDELRQSIAAWLTLRFQLAGVDADRQVLPVNGTREALFAFAQTIVDRRGDATVISPNPFYQIYEGAALLAGASPHFLNCSADNGYLPNFDDVTADQWQRCQLLYICTPGNPTGAVMPQDQLQALIRLAHEHDFVIASDECYSEIYGDEDSPPPGLLQACAAMGDDSYKQCMIFHSLSKRSNLPGLRSGFVAGDADLIARFLQYRTYHGCAMPGHHQLASIAAWSDEQHVIENRARYKAKFDAVLEILGNKLDVDRPEAGFYLWPETPVAETEFARALFAQQHVTVLPGSFLAREVQGVNPGANRVRMALVAELEQCVEAAQRIAHCMDTL
ncbi:succinyldiaminopimelate transaminase [Halioglobus maricola]|uniref:Succinyldiaminopimelate transaminase n=1 Tax=Halioglobus maricola TaxID=2601894 RepID=A0A5P9NG85_9GAMM|nr:succinyldiaminopimelate transaminase [Halioglobus maricola]QFU74820.1 succinyldiaminopimelate transaminase [Halioglobus maricola]